MLCQVSCHPGTVHKLAIDASPEPLSSLSSHVFAKVRIFARIKRAETVGAILIWEMMAGIEFAVRSTRGLHRLIEGLSDQTRIVGHQAVRTEP